LLGVLVLSGEKADLQQARFFHHHGHRVTLFAPQIVVMTGREGDRSFRRGIEMEPGDHVG
jgi:hypothetical protein